MHQWFNLVEDSYPHGPKIGVWQMTRQPYHNMMVVMQNDGSIVEIKMIEPYEVNECEC